MKTITLFILFFIYIPLFSQSNQELGTFKLDSAMIQAFNEDLIANSEYYSDSFKNEMYDFLISTHDLSESGKSNNSMLIINDLVTNKVFTNQEYGIFRFGTFLTSSAYKHILLISNGKYTIVNMHEPLEKSLQNILDFFKEDTIFSKEGVIMYIERVLVMHKLNKNAVIQEWQYPIIGNMYELLEKLLQTALDFLNTNESFSKEDTIKYIEGVLDTHKRNIEAIPLE